MRLALRAEKNLYYTILDAVRSKKSGDLQDLGKLSTDLNQILLIIN
jgi:hypothetical protein